ncbi:MAG: helix-turn-helix transcriptional regulator [Clostridia bacterium]|nr:helix-turn-helix transcriptional regulator [Clostridia bacterium]
MHTDVLSDLVISKVVSVSAMYSEVGASGKRTQRDRWAIIIKYEGETVYSGGGREYVSNHANIALLPKGSSYEWRCVSQGHYYSLEFECDTCCEEIFVFPVKNSEKILKLFKETEYIQTLKRPYCEIESIRNVYSILINLIRSEPKRYLPGEKQAKIAPALEHIAKNYALKITNAQLAELCGISCVYFRKLFADTVGMPPLEYVHSLRIKKAKEMLDSDYGSISDIAASLGYSSIYDFSRTFKKQVGVSPSKYR